MNRSAYFTETNLLVFFFHSQCFCVSCEKYSFMLSFERYKLTYFLMVISFVFDISFLGPSGVNFWIWCEVGAQPHFLIMNNHLFQRLAMPFWSHSETSHLCRSFLGSLFHWANDRFLHPHCSIWITMCYTICPGTWKKWSFPELLKKVLVFVAPYSSTEIFESSDYVSWKKKNLLGFLLELYWIYRWRRKKWIDIFITLSLIYEYGISFPLCKFLKSLNKAKILFFKKKLTK